MMNVISLSFTSYTRYREIVVPHLRMSKVRAGDPRSKSIFNNEIHHRMLEIEPHGMPNI